MKVVIAPDSYKGSLTAIQVCEAIGKGILSVFPHAELTKLPVADGGEGTVEALIAATGGKLVRETVIGPLGGPAESFWGMLGDGETAVIEMAAASGLTLVPKEQRNPEKTTTYGTGELIKAIPNQDLQ